MPASWRSQLLILAILAPATLCAADWPQFLGPERNGTSTEKGLNLSWPRQGPPVVWQKPVGPGLSGPVIAGKRLILFHRVGDEEVLACLDAETGAELWKLATPTAYQDDLGAPGDVGPRSTPCINGDRVYALGAEGRLFCVQLDSGKRIWGRPLNDEYRVRKGFFGVATSPIVVNDLVVVNVGGPGAGIVALDKATGKERWKATDHQASYSSPVAATIDGVYQLICFTREGVVALDPVNGAVRFSKRWRARISASVNAATPLVVDDRIFVSASYNTGALLLRARGGAFEELWHSDEVLSNHFNTSVVRDGYLYGLDGRQEEGARLRCVELSSGKVRWTQERFGCASLIATPDGILALTERGELVVIESTPMKYHERARTALLGSTCRAHPALANGLLYARDSEKLMCWSLRKQ